MHKSLTENDVIIACLKKKTQKELKCKSGTHQISAQTGTEVVEHAISVRLRHFRVNVITAVSKIGDFLS